jgi:hypothetical protein
MSKDAIEVKDELLTVYIAAAADDSFVPATRVKSAVMMYARTLAEHRNAFPGSVAHENAAEETELASVPRDNKTLDPRPLPIKPLSSDGEEEGTQWPRDLPPAVQGSAWQSLGKWVAAATAGGLALGASYSWFNASRQHSAAPEPMIAQAPAAPPVVVVPPVAVATAEPPAARAEATEASPRREVAEAAAPRAKAELAKPAVVKKVAPKNSETKLAKAPNATSNPPVAVADGKPVAAPQVSAAPLPNYAGNTVATSGAVAASSAPAEAVAMNDAVSVDSKAKRAASPQAGAASMSTMEGRASGADGRANTADARVSAALGRPEHEAVPEKWMVYITDLKNRGRTREADIELMRLRERYPQFNIGKPTKFIDRPMNKPTDSPVDAPSPAYTPTTPPSQPR